MKIQKIMEKFKKFKQEYKKDFDIPALFAKEKDIFMYLFLLLRRKMSKGIFPELYNSEIMFSKSVCLFIMIIK